MAIIFGSGRGEYLKGTSSQDIIFGRGGDAVIHAGAGDGIIHVTGGDSRVLAEAGDDIVHGIDIREGDFDGGSGDDTMNGRSGYDTASHAGRGESIAVQADGKIMVGLHETDTLVAVEKVTGGDRFLAGAVRDFDGGKGRDTCYADGKAGTFDGGEGADYTVYTASTSDVGVDLQSGTGWLGFAKGDRLISVEDVAGSYHADILRGSAADDFLAGLDGDAVIDGRGGDDTIHGGKGADILTGGAGHDSFIFATSEGYAQDRIADFQPGIDRIVIQGDANIHVSGMRTFTRLTRYEDSTPAAGVTAGTINIRHEGATPMWT